MLKQLVINRRYILKKSIAATTSIYALLGFISLFADLNSLLGDEMTIGCRVLISALALFVVWGVCLIGACVHVIKTRKRKVVDGQNGKGVYVIYGDLFGESIVPDTPRRSICFAVNRCFDTIVDDHLVSSASIHGYAMRRLYEEKTFSPESLDAAIQRAIPSSTPAEKLSVRQKPKGNLKRYEVGTAVDVRVSSRDHYFMIGLSSFDSDLKASTSIPDYCLAIQKTIEFCDANAQGYPVLMPIMGGFLSRTGLREKDLLEYIVKCFEFNKKHINADYYIVVRESAKDLISIVDL